MPPSDNAERMEASFMEGYARTLLAEPADQWDAHYLGDVRGVYERLGDRLAVLDYPGWPSRGLHSPEEGEEGKRLVDLRAHLRLRMKQYDRLVNGPEEER